MKQGAAKNNFLKKNSLSNISGENKTTKLGMPGCVRHPTVRCNPRRPERYSFTPSICFPLPDNKRRFLPNWNDENPHRSSVRIPSGPDVSAIQTRVASRKSSGVGIFAYQSNSGTQCLGAKRIAHFGCR